MPSSPKLQNWFLVEFSLTPFENPGALKGFYFTNRYPLYNTDRAFYLPLLRNISGLGMSAGNDVPIPTASGGTVIIENSPNSYGFQRKFSDWLERFSAIDQTITIKACQTPMLTDSVDGQWVTVWTGVIKDVSISVSDNSVSLTVESNTIDKRIVTKVIDSVKFPQAPQSSIGKHLPIVLGEDVDVKPYSISPSGGGSPSFVYATTLGSNHGNGGVQAYWVKNRHGKYSVVINPTNTTTPVISYYDAVNQAAGGIGKEVAYWFFSSIFPYAIVQGRMLWYGTGDPTLNSPGSFFFYLYESTNTFQPGRVLAKAEVKKSAYLTQLRGSAAFYIDFSFDKVVISDLGFTNGGYGLFFGWSQTFHETAMETIPTAVFNTANITTFAGQLSYKPYNLNTASDEWYRAGVLASTPMFDLYGIYMTDTNAPVVDFDSDGHGHSYITLQQKAAASGQTNPDISNLDMLLTVDGLRDDSSGTITGTPNAVLTTAQHQSRALTRQWNGSNFVDDPDYNYGTYSYDCFTNPAHRYFRKNAGATEGRVTLEDVLSRLYFNSGCRLVRRSNGKFALYPWYGRGSSVATITNENGRIQGIYYRNTSTVINRIEAHYHKRLVDISDSSLGNAEGNFKNYAGHIDWFYATNPETMALSYRSTVMYGPRSLGQNTFDLLQDKKSAENMMVHFLSKYAFPHVYVEVDVDFFEFSHVEIMDVVDILDPALPANFGTSPEQVANSFGGTRTIQGNDGGILQRAKLYRAQVEGRDINFNMGSEETPTLRFRARLLTNFPMDPT